MVSLRASDLCGDAFAPADIRLRPLAASDCPGVPDLEQARAALHLIEGDIIIDELLSYPARSPSSAVFQSAAARAVERSACSNCSVSRSIGLMRPAFMVGSVDPLR